MFVHPADWYAEHDVDLRLGARGHRARPGAPTSVDDSTTASRVRYDKLLLATGSTPRRLRLPGADLDGVHYLRTLDDTDALRAALTAGERRRGRSAAAGSAWRRRPPPAAPAAR